jgi:hypothetical protein
MKEAKVSVLLLNTKLKIAPSAKSILSRLFVVCIDVVVVLIKHAMIERYDYRLLS